MTVFETAKQKIKKSMDWEQSACVVQHNGAGVQFSSTVS